MVVAGGGRILVMVVIVVVMEMVSPGLCQTNNRGTFQIYKSCGSSESFSSPSIRNSNLVVNNPMWLRGTTEAVTLITLKNTSTSCLLPANTTHQVTIGIHLRVHVGGASEEEKQECSFPKDTTFQLPRGVLMVSCLPERSQAEAEMLGDEEFSRSAPSTTRPQHSAFYLPSIQDTIQDAPTRPGPQDSREPLKTLTTFQLTGVGLSGSSGAEHLKTTVMVAGSASSTMSSLMGDGVMKTTEMQNSEPEHVTEGGTAEATRETTSTTPVNITHQSDIEKENMRSNVPQSGDDHTSDELDDHFIYLAGAGTGMLALLLGVVVVVSVVHYRRRQAKARAKQEDLFISGVYRGSTHSLNHNVSDGAYFNAYAMYSGAEQEFVESFELEERILNSSISYSSHDIPKCLKKVEDD